MRRKRSSKPSPREKQQAEALAALRKGMEGQGWRIGSAEGLNRRGGYCILRGERRILLRSKLSASDRFEVLLEALRAEGETLPPDLPDEVRAMAGDMPAAVSSSAGSD